VRVLARCRGSRLPAGHAGAGVVGRGARVHRRRWLAGIAFAAACALLVGATPLARPAPARAATLPTGFQETIVFSGLTEPTVVQFASDGRVFVGEKSGLVKVFDNLSDTTPTVFADLRTQVHNFWDRGLLGMALDPSFPTRPYVYVLYAYDAAIGGTAPRWGTPGATSDGCPTPPGATDDGCVISGRVSRLTASGNVMTGSEQVLVEDWCQQYPSHSIGSLAFGADGALYVSGGDGASFNFVDYGQDGNPLNPCGDPPGGVGATLTPPTAEGGALRSQDLRTGTDPTGLSGTVLRINPDTGAPLPDNPLTGPDTNARRIVASGLRNPFRFTVRPGTSEVWLGDVGWDTWEEIDRVASPTAGAVNFGWPCYEGAGRQGGYDGANLNVCENLYTQSGAVTAPYYTYNHSATVVSGEACPTGSSSISGMAFAGSGGSYPAAYDGALFFADYSRDCIWAMLKGTNGLPDPNQRQTFAAAAANPVDLKIGPGGDLFYVDLAGTIRRISYQGTNTPPTAVIQANPTSGAAPLTVSFDGRSSSDPDPGDGIASYSWDLNGDNVYGDATTATTSYTYADPGTYTARLKVTDRKGATSTPATVTITANNTPPVPVISAPPAGTTWKVGDLISFSGSANDAQDGPLPDSALSWNLTLEHCPSNCHTHNLQSWPGVASGSFTAPDHEYPSYLQLKLTATDSGGLTGSTTLRLDPKTVALTFTSDPSKAQITVGSFTGTTTFTRTVIIGSSNTVSALTPQRIRGKSYVFSRWSDGGAQTHTIVAPATPTTYSATFVRQ
jgi:glucose/arabinose dehydrogenase